MCDCFSPTLASYYRPRIQSTAPTNYGLVIFNHAFPWDGAYITQNKPLKSTTVGPSSSYRRSDDPVFYSEQRLNQRGKWRNSRENDDEGAKIKEPEFLEFDAHFGRERVDVDAWVEVRGSEGGGSLEHGGTGVGKVMRRRGRQVMKRSDLIVKQVISIESALCLGFVSQLWVNPKSWTVLIIEVRPNFLSGELERFLLDDISQVGDVVLIHDECVMDCEYKMVGLETLVGYNVVTPYHRTFGKVRGYTFNVNSGAIGSLELDSFGISIIPSTLVSTYALPVEDVLEVLSDSVVVNEAAASHMQRITKGFWDGQKPSYPMHDLWGYSDQQKRSTRSNHGRGRRGRSPANQKSHKELRDDADDLGLPMDYM